MALLYSPGTNAVTNGDFESEFSGWTKSGSSSSQIEGQAGTSDHALRLASGFVPNDGVPGTEGSDGGNSTVSQRLTVPSGRPYLAFAYRVETSEPVTGTDSFEVIAVEDGQAANYLLVQRQGSGWQYRSFDMGQYAGKEITLILNVYETSPNRRTSALVDLVTLQRCAWAEPSEQRACGKTAASRRARTEWFVGACRARGQIVQWLQNLSACRIELQRRIEGNSSLY